MKYILWPLLCLVFFWLGVAHEYARRPSQIIYRVQPAQQANEVILRKESCGEIYAICKAKRRMATVGQK